MSEAEIMTAGLSGQKYDIFIMYYDALVHHHSLFFSLCPLVCLLAETAFQHFLNKKY